MTTTEQLTSIADYLERQTDLAFLDYRRATQTSPGSPATWDGFRFQSAESILYARWIGIGDAYYLIQDLLKSESDRIQMWREFLLALMARDGGSRHEIEVGR